MKRKIAVFTGTRAEYGLLYWVMRDIRASPQLDLSTIVSGTHLSPEFGETWMQIEADGFPVDAKVEMLLSSNTPVGVVKSIGLGVIGYADALDRLKPDLLVVLGDRFEALAVAQAALIMRIPIAHIHGGERTDGAYDDAIRHAITKMANLHFTAAEPYRQRVMQLGESPDTVFNVGAVGLDHLTRSAVMTRQALASNLNFDLSGRYFLATYHPVTAADEDAEATTRAMMDAMARFPDCRVILTYPNADNGGRSIIPILETFAAAAPERLLVVPSLGFDRYLAALKEAVCVIGNSSSGIIEAPSAGVPTVNIGVRQRGRLAASSVLHCAAETESIAEAISTALSPDFAKTVRETLNPYGAGNAAEQIVGVMENASLTTVKRFHDLDFQS